jgi:DNA-binding FadR family transcriptional regulator
MRDSDGRNLPSAEPLRDMDTGRRSPADAIADYLSAGIRDGMFETGSRLPTEQALSRQFEVSRTVVREAVSRLKSDGLVSSRQGSGVFVTPVATRRSFKLDDPIVAGSAEVRKMMELRQPIEVAAARLAAVRRSSDDMDRLFASHEAMRSAEVWSEAGVLADLDFHHAIALATGNEYYANFMAFLGSVMSATIATARMRSIELDIKSITIAEHQRILSAIERQNPEDCALAMAQHLQGALIRMGS